MKFIADLHIHSFYSRATSKDLTFEHLYKWACMKGVNVVATGDIAHPGWLKEMREKLEPAEEGLFKLKDDYVKSISQDVPKACNGIVRFLIGGEISNIYKKNEKVRKIHSVVFAPNFEATEKLQAKLEKIGNIRSDGRPILGLDARDLLEIVLNVDRRAYLIPAHIWTPWFSLLGSKSGFDSVEECFEDLTGHIFALETGLSSDPPMNWRLSQLDKYTLVSNSDAHSPQKLAREANVFNTELSYDSLFEAIKTSDDEKFWGTIEFFPEEGKYHYDGHRKCGIRWDPKTTLANNCICSVCGKPVTVGVSHRVETLADRQEGEKSVRAHPFKSLIPLPEILAEIYRVGDSSKKVIENYDVLLQKLGSELSILREVPLEDIRNAGSELLAEGIRRMRNGEVTLAGGYDGEYGVIKLFDEGEREKFDTQIGFFEIEENKKAGNEKTAIDHSDGPFRLHESGARNRGSFIGIGEANQGYEFDDHSTFSGEGNNIKMQSETDPIFSGLNEQQSKAVLCIDTPLIIVAGPGTGKTRTLTHRIAYLVTEIQVSPENILAITFTNKAAGEMQSRLLKLLGNEKVNAIAVKTFHSFGAMILRNEAKNIELSPTFTILNANDANSFLKNLYPEFGEKEIDPILENISSAKNKLMIPDSRELIREYGSEFNDIYKNYNLALKKNQLLDFDDLIMLTVRLFVTVPEVLHKYRARFKWISVDEYQDVNFAQYSLLKLLIGSENNICVIGDPDQAIYGFRGSDRKYFLKFHEDFPNAKKLQLIRNYRSSGMILNASGQVISKGGERENIELLTDFASKTKIDIYRAPTYKAEAEYIVHQIESMIGGTSYFSLDSGRVDDDTGIERSFSDFAVLYRLGAQSHALIEAFQRSGIPYQTIGDVSLFEKKEIKEIITYLRFIYNPDSVFFRQQVNKYFDKIVNFLEELRLSFEQQTVSELIVKIRDYLIAAKIKEQDDKWNELINKLTLSVGPFENRLKDFLESTVLKKEIDEYDPRADRVVLMTMHASKGLEFPVVFIAGCEENIIPYQRENKKLDIEEERRLFYVGMTRAKEKLILTHANKRFLFGKMTENPPSRFLNDMEAALKELKKSEYYKKKSGKKKGDTDQIGLF